MRALIQRVSEASVTVDGEITGQIAQGLLVLLGITEADTKAEAEKLAAKIAKLRIFNDDAGKMNRSVQDLGAEVLLVSQFTLYADVHKGNRPSYLAAAHPDKAIPLYEYLGDCLQQEGLRIAKGIFGANMDVRLLNQGPVTIWLDTEIF